MNARVDIGLDRVLLATGGSVVRKGPERFSAAVIDGRSVPAGALFFAVKGESFDGHDFAGQAVAGGATGVVVERGRGQGLAGGLQVLGGATVIEVDDTVAALGRLGRAHREAMPGLKVVGVTGSNGKTTTKEILASIFAASVGAEAVLKTEGNLNNHLGVPLTLLRLTAAHRFAVVEMGMSALGEIAYLTQLARPDVGVVVSVAPVHLETLGSLENIARAKGEIWQGLGERGVAVLPVDEPLLAPHAAHVPPAQRRTFGPQRLSPTVGYDRVRSDHTGLAFTLHLSGLTSHSGVQAKMGLLGAHNASNAAAAAAAALALDVGEGSILDGLAHVKPAKHRAQLIAVGDRTVLDDCYNAAPLSMRAALDALVEVTPAGAQRIAVLGDMLELGPESPRLHREIGAYAGDRVDALILVGNEAAAMTQSAGKRLTADRIFHFSDPRSAATQVRAISRPGDVILVKASRGMRLERVIDLLAEDLT